MQKGDNWNSATKSYFKLSFISTIIISATYWPTTENESNSEVKYETEYVCELV